MKTRVSIINYCNTVPFNYGILQSKRLLELAELSYGYPSQVAEMLCRDETDLSIISVGAIPEIPNARIITDFCISASEHVDSVLLCSNKPLEEITAIVLDYQSRTSNILVQVLARHFWNISPTYEMGTAGYESSNDDAAKVIIGDRALENASRFAYVYDLAGEWHKAFGKPFVFAAWVANKQLPDEFVEEFSKACGYGVTHLGEAIASAKNRYDFDIDNYLRHSVEFDLTAEKRAVIGMFLEKGREMDLL